MSEYQYYEWQTIDRPLTSQERAAVDKLSSHITVTAAGAWVDYSWGSFKHDPKQVLARYFDAHLYLANWGSRRLAFRFPLDLLDPWPLQPYIVEPYISLQTVDDYHILSFDLDEEEPDEYWIEGQGWLASLAPLRNDILRGDYRALYLAWLHAVELDSGFEIAEDEPEPPVPPGLDQLTAALQVFVDLFNIDEQLLAAAAQTSSEVQRQPEAELANVISQLPREECDAFLRRLLQDEPHLALTLRRRLQALVETPAPAQASARRTVGDLLAMQEEMTAAARQRQAEAAQQRHRQEMENLAQRESALWQEVENLIETSRPKAYDEATQYLVKLRQLAEHRGTQAAFQAQVDQLAERYRRRTGLMSRLRQHQLV